MRTLDEHAYRYNRRKTKGVERLVARCFETMIAKPSLSLRQLVHNTHPAFGHVNY